MKVTRLDAVDWLPITHYDSDRSLSAQLATGGGESHAHVVRFDAGGRIGAHEAGFGQLFTFVVGRGWAAGPDGRRVSLAPGDVAWFARGELHSKGSDDGGTALMIQVRNLEPDATGHRGSNPGRARGHRSPYQP